MVNAPPPVHARLAAAVTPEVRHVVVSGIVEGEMEGVRAAYEAVGLDAAAGDGRRHVDRDAARARGWLICSTPTPRPRPAPRSGRWRAGCRTADSLISASRLVEINCRAAILIAPGLFRFDLTPQQETLGVAPRPLGDHGLHWKAEEASWDAYREQASRDAPLELRGLVDIPGDPMLAWVHVLSFTDRDAAAVHFVAKAEIRRPKQRTPARCSSGTSASSGRCRGARPATRTRCSSAR